MRTDGRTDERTDYVTFDFFTTYSANSLLQGMLKYEGWNFNSGNYLFTTDTK